MKENNTFCDICNEEIKPPCYMLNIKAKRTFLSKWFEDKDCVEDICNNCYFFIQTLSNKEHRGFNSFRAVYTKWTGMCCNDQDIFLEELLKIANNVDRYAEEKANG